MDNIDTASIAFGKLSGEFLRTQVVPELDAYRLSAYAQTKNVTKVSADIADGKAGLAALREGRNHIENAEQNLQHAICLLIRHFME